MKKIFFTGITAIAVLGTAGLMWINQNDVINAQTSPEEHKKLVERDESISKDMVEKAYAEAKQISDSILAIIAQKKSNFRLHSKHASHLISGVPGRPGETRNDFTWRSSDTQLRLNVNLGTRKDEQIPLFRRRLEYISMGEFFEIQNIGDEAVLVKNVQFNKKMTNVGLHFVKGRVQVETYLTNHQRSTEKNQKELMEFVRLIEPLIIARPNIDD